MAVGTHGSIYSVVRCSAIFIGGLLAHSVGLTMGIESGLVYTSIRSSRGLIAVRSPQRKVRKTPLAAQRRCHAGIAGT